MSPYHTRGAVTKKERTAPSTNTLYLGDIPVAVTRKRVRNFNLRVRADGSVHLSMPQRATLDAAQRMLNRHAAWVEKRVARARSAAAQPAAGPLETGWVPLWERRAELRVREDAQAARPHVRVVRSAAPSGTPGDNGADGLADVCTDQCAACTFAEGGMPRAAALPQDARGSAPSDGPASENASAPQLEVTLPAGLGDAERAEAVRALVDRVYRAEIARALPAVAAPYERALGVHASAWSLRRMKTRWGSCTPKTARMRLNLQLAAYPPQCLSYVVAHELTHLLEPSHNARFHALLKSVCPAADEARKRLRQPPVREASSY